MKIVVILLALLATMKFGHQEYLYRTSTNEVIIAAYRERAVQACGREPKSQNLAANVAAWTRPASIRLAIGKSNLDVYFWQTDHALWNARYRNPYLFLIADQTPANVFCEYDVINGVASVYRM